jgi:enamine deaminase RidA (YjgF/YER057c/UK114 family)
MRKRGSARVIPGPWEHEFLCLVPERKTPPREQLDICLTKLRTKLRDRGLRPGHVLKLDVFVRASGASDYFQRRRSVAAGLRAFFPGSRPAVSVISQPPEGGRETALEAVFMSRASESVEVIPKSYRGIPYVLVRARDGREVFVGGIDGGRRGNIGIRTTAAFRKAAGLLAREGLGLADIVRQWNFIEDLLGGTRTGGRVLQNYQIFNDVRALAYGRAGLRTGFPAATGIGMDTGGFLLEFIAAHGTAAERSFPISNPDQVDAHRYSGDVLVGTPFSGRAGKQTPKFERARVVISGNSGTCYVSGTAAIVGQEVAGKGDVVEQTRVTIRNIVRLVDPSNLRAAGAPVLSVAPRFSYVRAYVKDGDRIPDVRKIVRAAFGNVPSLFLVSDICRDDLLVEIEGAVRVRTD